MGQIGFKKFAPSSVGSLEGVFWPTLHCSITGIVELAKGGALFKEVGHFLGRLDWYLDLICGSVSTIQHPNLGARGLAGSPLGGVAQRLPFASVFCACPFGILPLNCAAWGLELQGITHYSASWVQAMALSRGRVACPLNSKGGVSCDPWPWPCPKLFLALAVRLLKLEY